MKVAICTHSILSSISVGESYEVKPRKHGKLVDIGAYIGRVDGDEITISGGPGRIFATLSTAEAKETKRKSLLKMLVRAHVNYAKSRGWGDSKSGAHKSWRGTPYKSTSDWARCFALGYDLKAIEQDAEAEGQPLDQDFVNWFIDEQMSYF